MNWELIGIAAEVVSALAVVATLAFLVVEIRNSRTATQTATLEALSVGFNETNYNVVESREFAEVWERGLRDPGSLDAPDQIRFSMYMQCYINHFTALQKYHQLQVLPDEEWQSFLDAIVNLMNTPGGKWLDSRLTIPPGLRAEIQAYGPPRQEFGWSIPRQNPPNKSLESDA